MAETGGVETRQLNWFWLFGCVVVGGVLVGFAFYAEDRWRWKGVSLSALVTFGAAFALAGVLFLVERRFTKAVRASVRRVEKVEAAFEERATALEARLADLTGATEARVQQHAAEQDAVVQRIVEHASFESVTQLLGAANEMNALDRGMVNVQASPNPEGVWLRFGWGYDTDSEGNRVGNRLAPTLDVRVTFGDDRRTSSGRDPYIRYRWLPDQPADAFGAQIVTEVQKQNLWRNGELDMSLTFENLRRSVDVALKSRRDEPGAWKLHGDLIELIGKEWALTTAGVEAPGHEFLLPQGDFPEAPRPGPASIRPIEPKRPSFEPKPPTWADEDEWRFVLARAKTEFPRSESIAMLIGSSWVPCPMSWESWVKASSRIPSGATNRVV